MSVLFDLVGFFHQTPKTNQMTKSSIDAPVPDMKEFREEEKIGGARDRPNTQIVGTSWYVSCAPLCATPYL